MAIQKKKMLFSVSFKCYVLFINHRFIKKKRKICAQFSQNPNKIAWIRLIKHPPPPPKTQNSYWILSLLEACFPSILFNIGKINFPN